MALVYPGIVADRWASATMIFTMIFVIPRFSAMFEELGSTLPLPTRILIGISTSLLQYGWAAGRRHRRRRRPRSAARSGRPPGRGWWHRVAPAHAAGPQHRPRQRLRELRPHARHAAGQRRARCCRRCPSSRTRSATSVIAEAIREARDRVTDGTTISGPLAQGKVFPPLLTDMLAIGEETGDMSGALDAHRAAATTNELDRSVKIFTTVLEPIMIAVHGRAGRLRGHQHADGRLRPDQRVEDPVGDET